ncbi:SWITCH/sucrose nonfermenting 3A [Tasmannia lanceolata]|uniref:SWITCH/sucrose nonfermenting 3A n=1 Tax=Tasmannia lanceolata TaxID=3420 RepID=UPI004062BAB2
MQNNEDDKSLQPITPDHDLYTIPHYSSWFSWDEIHDTEKTSLTEFFDGTSFSKTPKIYKEYRDFIINKYREDPLRRLSFTEIRKSLIGDVFSIHKVFLLLEDWGLINFRVLSSSSNEDNHRGRVDVVSEDGPPNGIRVTADPNSLKPLSGSSSLLVGNEIDGTDDRGGFRLPPLTSYSDVFGEISRKRGLVCGNCGEECGSGHYESAKQENFIICIKCYRSENFKGSHSADDFKFDDLLDGSVNHGSDTWAEAETMLLLEAVLKHGDDWDLIAQQVGTKTKVDCISRLIQLPFGEHMLGSANSNGDNKNSSMQTSNIKPMEATSDVKPMEAPSVDPHEPTKIDDQHYEYTCETEEIEKGDMLCPPLKRRCIISFADAGSSLMKQVALLSTVAGPHIAAAAAEAAVAALCNENPCARKIFDAEEDNITCDFGYRTLDKESERVAKVEDSETEEVHKQSETLETTTPEKKSGLSTLQIRAAIATAVGAAAAHAKLLADQEDREIELLMATMIDTQMRKIQYKIKHFEELELIMEKEYSEIQKVKESILGDRIDLLQRAFKAGISRWRGIPVL